MSFTPWRRPPGLRACLVVLSAALTASSATAGPKEEAPPEGPARADHFPDGEVLRYVVKGRYSIFSATGGGATITVRSDENLSRETGGDLADRRLARITFHLRSKGWVHKLYPVDDRSTSLVDVETGGTARFHFVNKEKGETDIERFTWSPGSKVVESMRLPHGGKESRRKTKVSGPVCDMVSVFYSTRRMKLKLGTMEDVTVFNKHDAHPLHLAVDGLERFKVDKVGDFWALRIHPSAAIPGLFSAKGNATIWVEETTHVLLRMRVQSGSSSATMTLVDARKSPLLKAPGAAKGGK